MGSHPLRTPPCEGGGRRLPGSPLRAYFFVQSGHGHWSQPQPVHALRIIAALLEKANELLAEPPQIEHVDVLAAKLP